LSHSRWNLLPPVPDKDLWRDCGYAPLVVQLLYNRGVTKPDALKHFIASDKSLSADPMLLQGMPQAVSRIYQALLSGETIGVFGDFDADGITATTVLVQGLTALGGKAVPYIPHRQTEGHGLSTGALKNLFKQGISLVITVDCGVTDVVEVAKAKKMGLDIIITDHHSPPDEIPKAVAVINPKLNNSCYPFSQLAGVGVAYKLLQAVLQSVGKEEHLNSVIDLVAVGTIADMSPVVGENRYLIKEGIKRINESPRPGIKELMNLTKIDAGKLDAERISWTISPCLNAAGRLADGLTGFNLLITESTQKAQEIAAWLVQKNEERQHLTNAMLERAREQVTERGLPPLLIADGREYHIGVAGLVAGRLTEEFYHPAIVIQVEDKVSHASCRSVPEFNIIKALNQFSHLFTRYGGHAQAAGFTLPTENLTEVCDGLSQLATEQLTGVELLAKIDIDAEVTLPELGGNTYQDTQLLAPFGVGNPVPMFLSRSVEVLERRTMGANGDHLRLKLRQGGTVWDAVGFRLGAYASELSPMIDIVYNLEIDHWNNREKLRLCIQDFEGSE
jgi:single-stranded-DNA-specific exonuclease